jgi:hypothetical protein
MLSPYQLLCHNCSATLSRPVEGPGPFSVDLVRTDVMMPRELEEYKSLRATVRERGTARIWIFVSGVAAWAAASLATTALAAPPVATIVPLLVLVAVFEAVFALHVGVERIGRYLQVFFETDAEVRKWEHTAMAFGRPKSAARLDALFSIPFALAALVNMLPAMIVGPTRPELIFVGGAHALFLLRLGVARGVANKQRAADLERFRELYERGT